MKQKTRHRHVFSTATLPCLLLAGGAVGAPIPHDPPSPGSTITQEDLDMLPRTESVATRLAELGSNQFSTTTKLSGLATFNLNNSFTGSGHLAELGSNQFSTTTKLRGDAVLNLGRNGFVVDGTLGYTNNAWNALSPNDVSSSYAGVGVQWLKDFQVRSGTAYLGFDASHFLFENDLPHRDGNDENLGQYGLQGGVFLNLAPNVQFTSRNQFSYGSFGNLGLGTVRSGILDSDLSAWRSESYLNYQFGRSGFGSATGLLIAGYNESSGNWWDQIIKDTNCTISACITGEMLHSPPHGTRKMDCSLGGFGNETRPLPHDCEGGG